MKLKLPKILQFYFCMSLWVLCYNFSHIPLEAKVTFLELYAVVHYSYYLFIKITEIILQTKLKRNFSISRKNAANVVVSIRFSNLTELYHNL